MPSTALESQPTDNALARIFTEQPAALPPIDPSAPVVLYGAGQLGRLAVSFCRHVGVRIRFVIDRNAHPGQLLDGIPVIQAVDNPSLRHTVLVAVVTSAYSRIKGDLYNAGCHSVMPFYDYAQCFASVHPLNNGWFAGPLSEQERQEIRYVLDRLSDPGSQAAYLQFLAWRVLREEWCFSGAPVVPDNRYFIPEVLSVLTSKEDVVDCGAYDGRFALDFLKHTSGDFGTLRLFEPDPGNLSLLQQNLTALSPEQAKRVRLFDRALSDRCEVMPFSHGFDMMSRLCAEAHSTVSAVRLDDMAVSPTYLKVHVEGSELEVLTGAARTLNEYRPIIAVSVYHNRDGLWKLPCYLVRLLDSYHFIFRLHTWCGTGAVLYGIPNERQLHTAAGLGSFRARNQREQPQDQG